MSAGVWNVVFGCDLKNDRMTSVHCQGKPFNITEIQVYAPTTNTEEVEAKQFYEDLQNLLAAAAAAKSLQSCPTLWNPTDGSPPGSPVPGILQARVLEWVAISFSNAWKWKVKVKVGRKLFLGAKPWRGICHFYLCKAEKWSLAGGRKKMRFSEQIHR